MNWLLLFEIIYIIVLVPVCMWIIYETRSTTKALSYLLLVIFLPILGIFFYLSFGTNYRKRKIYNKKLIADEHLGRRISDEVLKFSRTTFLEGGSSIINYKELAYMLANDASSLLTSGNTVTLLLNGEHKFAEVIKAINEAKHHIHIEYYIYEDDEIGKTIEQLLIKKAEEGIMVRFIYDD